MFNQECINEIKATSIENYKRAVDIRTRMIDIIEGHLDKDHISASEISELARCLNDLSKDEFFMVSLFAGMASPFNGCYGGPNYNSVEAKVYDQTRSE